MSWFSTSGWRVCWHHPVVVPGMSLPDINISVHGLLQLHFCDTRCGESKNNWSKKGSSDGLFGDAPSASKPHPSELVYSYHNFKKILIISALPLS